MQAGVHVGISHHASCLNFGENLLPTTLTVAKQWQILWVFEILCSAVSRLRLINRATSNTSSLCSFPKFDLIEKSPFEIASKRLEMDLICQWGANRNPWAGYQMCSFQSPHTPNREVVNRRPQIDHIMWGRRAT